MLVYKLTEPVSENDLNLAPGDAVYVYGGGQGNMPLASVVRTAPPPEDLAPPWQWTGTMLRRLTAEEYIFLFTKHLSKLAKTEPTQHPSTEAAAEPASQEVSDEVPA